MSDLLPDTNDPHLWLEEIYDPRALEWVGSRNARSLSDLKQSPLFAPIEKDLRALHTAKDRLPVVTERGGYLYNFWQDADHVKGIWRRTTPESFATDDIHWETLLDVDALAASENESWVYQGADCLAPDYHRCLISLSRGGKDAAVVREFDLRSKRFVTDGFVLPEGKSRVAWIDAETVFLGLDTPGGTTKSGYPKDVRVWKRGQTPLQATIVFSGEESDVSTSGFSFRSPEGTRSYILRSENFFDCEYHAFDSRSGRLRRIDIPVDARMTELFHGRLYFTLRKPWTQGDRTFAAGSLIHLPVETLDPAQATLAWEPTDRSGLLDVFANKSHLFLMTQEDVKTRLFHVAARSDAPGTFRPRPIEIPDFSVLGIASAGPWSDRILLTQQSFLVPPAIAELAPDPAARGGFSIRPLKKLPARFGADDFEAHQYFASSKDGTAVPYFIVHRKALEFDGSHRTLLNAYGGFEVSKTPAYLANIGKAWLERGGVYVSANIRGGGEYGPRWHQAALRENRQRAFDDFFAVAEDLIRRKVTQPRHLGAMGGSNGGLLMGVALTQRPDLFGAIVCQVPLLDMLRFHKLLAGHSWTAEYGNPDVGPDRDFIAKYSPYQNLRPNAPYPKVFFVTSTADDRVHPGHARKMAAKMEELGKDFYYFENMEGGHAAGADLEQIILRQALEYSYLHRLLG